MSKLADIGKAENQPVSVGVMEVAEEEIARLQKQNEELIKALRWILQDLEVRHLADSMSHSIYTRASRALGYPVGIVGKPMLPDWDEETADLVQQNENQAQTIRVQAETIARLERQFDSLSLEECIDLAYSKHKAQMPPQAPTSPKEPPIAPETANVPGEPKPVHPAPNVTIAGGE